ncbi:hypothetical protein [Bacillus cereus]|uniref:hypothetical protein n=1 Tax=Bacillus cereus TaxID=1396 RepID=UPI000BF6E7B9|nr:hypothetical protein [Bacillus cereus]PFM41530.1 hypothetical protein COJ43_08545 [Bacillus cereus]
MRDLLEGFNMVMWTGAFVIGVVLVLWWYGRYRKAGVKFREYMDVMGSMLTCCGGVITVIVSVVDNKTTVLIYIGLLGIVVGGINVTKKIMDLYDRVSTIKTEQEEETEEIEGTRKTRKTRKTRRVKM